MLDKDRWRKIRELLDGAEHLSGKEQEAWLAQACADDRTLYDEVFNPS